MGSHCLEIQCGYDMGGPIVMMNLPSLYYILALPVLCYLLHHDCHAIICFDSHHTKSLMRLSLDDNVRVLTVYLTHTQIVRSGVNRRNSLQRKSRVLFPITAFLPFCYISNVIQRIYKQ